MYCRIAIYLFMDAKHKIISYRQAGKVADQLHKAGKKIVFKSGCFDLFHIGHVRALQAAKNQGDILFISLGNDAWLRKYKGQGRPIFRQELRAELLASLACVDYVVIARESIANRIDHKKLFSIIKPQYYMLPPNDKALVEKRVFAKQYGAKIVFKSETRGKFASTTRLHVLLQSLG